MFILQEILETKRKYLKKLFKTTYKNITQQKLRRKLYEN